MYVYSRAVTASQEPSQARISSSCRHGALPPPNLPPPPKLVPPPPPHTLIVRTAGVAPKPCFVPRLCSIITAAHITAVVPGAVTTGANGITPKGYALRTYFYVDNTGTINATYPPPSWQHSPSVDFSSFMVYRFFFWGGVCASAQVRGRQRRGRGGAPYASGHPERRHGP